MNYDIPPYLRRQRRKIGLYGVFLAVVGVSFMSVALFVLLMDWGASHAHAAGVAGVIKNGQFFTPQEFCNTL